MRRFVVIVLDGFGIGAMMQRKNARAMKRQIL